MSLKYEPACRNILVGIAETSTWVMKDEVSREREFCIDNLMVRIHLIILMIRWTGLAPFPFPGSLISTFLVLSLVLLSAGNFGGHCRDVHLGQRFGFPSSS